MNFNQNFKISQVNFKTLLLEINVGNTTYYARAFA